MADKLSENEAALLSAVAFCLLEEMRTRLFHESPAPDLLHDLAQSNFEISCAALAQVGLLSREGYYWRVLKPVNDRPIFRTPHTRSDLDCLLDGLACHSWYVGDLYQHHEPVTPSEHALQQVCVAMAACGYMTPTSTRNRSFEWTDDFGPWLVRHGAWDLGEFEAASPKEVNAALATIPPNAKKRLSEPLCSPKPEFVRCFFAQWINGKWEEKEWRYAPSDDWDLSLATGLYARLHSQ